MWSNYLVGYRLYSTLNHVPTSPNQFGKDIANLVHIMICVGHKITCEIIIYSKVED